jgi:hypothetical protein
MSGLWSYLKKQLQGSSSTLVLPSIERRALVALYDDWQNWNASQQVKLVTFAGIAASLSLVGFDYLLFEDGSVYLPFRLGGAAILFLNFIPLTSSWPSRLKVPSSRWLLPPVLFFSWCYSYFLYQAPEQDRLIVLIGSFMVSLFCHLLIHLYWREHHLLTVLSLSVSLGLSVLDPKGSAYYVLIGIFQYFMGFFMSIVRREFVGALYSRYLHMTRLLPKKIAKVATISPRKDTLDKVFKPRMRFTACLCSDWRGYQKLAATQPPEVISGLFDRYYTLAFQELDRQIPSGDYLATWTADELFVIFYSEKDDPNEVLNNALQFALAVAGPLYQQALKELPLPIHLDVGLACGNGLLGLQGPSMLRKTTLSAEAAGIAKRLETEAKEQRSHIPDQENGGPARWPTLLMDRRLAEFAVLQGIVERGAFRLLSPTTKDLRDPTYYMWRKDLASRIQIAHCEKGKKSAA